MDTNEDPDSDREELVRRTVDWLETLSRRISDAHAAQFLGIAVTMPQAKVLYLVASRGQLHMSELATRLGVTLSTISGLVDRLVEAGLAVRGEDPADRRQIIVSPTELGLELVERFKEVNAAQVRALLDRVATADLVVVERAFAILAATAAAADPNETQTP